MHPCVGSYDPMNSPVKPLQYRPFIRGICFFVFSLIGLMPVSVAAQQAEAVLAVGISGEAVDAHPYGIIAASTGSLGYVAIAGDVTPFGELVEDYANYRIAEVDMHSLEVLRTFEVGYFPTELLLLEGNLYVTCSNDSNLYQIDLATAEVLSFPMTDSSGFAVTFLSGLVASSTGSVIVGSNGGNFDGSDENILVFDPISEAITQWVTVEGSITRFMEYDGEWVVPVGYPGNDFTAAPVVSWIDAATGTVTGSVNIAVDTADFPGPSDITDLGNGTALVTVYGGSAEVFLLDLAKRTLIETWPLESTDFSQSAALLLDDGRVLVSDLLGGWMKILDPQNGALETLATGLSLPVDLCLKSGRIFATEQGLEQVAVFSAPGSFVRGDANMDQTVDVSDPIKLLNYLFLGGDLTCEDAGDANDDGVLDLADAVNVLEFLFAAGSVPTFPFPVGGSDLLEDDLDCLPGT